MKPPAALLVTLLAVACRPPAEMPSAPPPSKTAALNAPIQTDKDRYHFEYGFYGPEVIIASTFTAPKDQTVYLMNCNGAISSGLQRLVQGAWITAWGEVTNSCLSEPIVIAPGQRRSHSITLRPGVGATVYPPESDLIEAGTYRVTWHAMLTSFDIQARPMGPELPLEQRVSAPFVIEAAPPKPVVITSIEPRETTTGRVPMVRVTFDFRRGDFRLEPDALRLYVDGVDVTEKSVRGSTEDVPPSQVELTYTPSPPFTSGWHGAKVELTDRAGKRHAYSWAFVAE